jgi:hypothetical protein
VQHQGGDHVVEGRVGEGQRRAEIGRVQRDARAKADTRKRQQSGALVDPGHDRATLAQCCSQ